MRQKKRFIEVGVTANTYGTWLRGDPRGWRERHHRKHIDGDFKNPPNWSFRDLMKRDEVRLGKQLQVILLLSIVGTLLNDGIEILVISLDDHHLHVLARFKDRQPRNRIGWAKQ